MSLIDNLPDSSEELINKLNEMFPSRCPTVEMTDREIWVEAGRRSLVDLLLTALETKNSLDS